MMQIMIAELILKVLALVTLPIVLGSLLFYHSATTHNLIGSKTILTYEAPYRSMVDANLGLVQDPHISIPVKTTRGYIDQSFLLDSGAAVSALPLSAAQTLGVNVATSRRIALQGFTGFPTFAYMDTITLLIGDHEFPIPATFSDAAGDSYILGRKGLFDDFTIQFDHDTHTIVLTRKI